MLPREERFAARTTEGLPPAHAPELGPCLLWTGTTTKKRGGYGAFYDDDRKLKRAHRVAWELATGDTLTPDMHVLHRCDNPPCVRYGHLRLGDQAANMEDMIEKGRRVSQVPRGESQYLAKLTDKEVSEARRRYATGDEVRSIHAALECAVSVETLRSAVDGRTWRHLPVPSYSNRHWPKGAKADHCPSNHEFTEENTAYSVDKQGYRTRRCKQCNRDRSMVNAAKRRAA